MKEEKRKKLYLGWSPRRGNPRPWVHFDVPCLMINAFDFWQRRGGKGHISEILGYKGETFCDSGGYQAMTRGERIRPECVIALQKSLGASLNAALDNNRDHRRHIWNFDRYMEELSRGFSFVPVVPHDLPDRLIRRIALKYPDPPLVAIGKVVPSLFPLTNRANVLTVLENIRTIKRRFPSSRLHVFGLGGTTTAALFFYLVDSTDSVSWLHDARFGKVRVRNGGVARSTRNGSMLSFKRSACQCPSCLEARDQIFTARGVEGLSLRATHNAWVAMKEMEEINESLRNGDYDHLVRTRLGRSPWHRGLLDAHEELVRAKNQ